MPKLKKIVRLNRSISIPLGLVLGVLCGLFFGEICGALDPVGKAYIGLLQMAILPYMMVSLIGGIGALEAEKAKRLAVTPGMVLLASWLLALFFVFLTPLMFPASESGTFYSPNLVELKHFDFLGLYIPVNPFRAMAQTTVPAVAVFSVVTGVALISVNADRKHGLLEVLNVMSTALTKVAVMVIRLAPFGLFAIAANAAGTMSVEQIGRLQVFIGSFVLMTLFLTFVVMPGIVAALTPFRFLEVLRASRTALLTGFATGNLFVVLPLLVEQGKLLFEERGIRTADTDSFIEVLIPISFNFPNLGKLLTLTFVLFAGWYTGNAVSLADYPMFSALGILSLFGGVDLALPFLLDQLRIPSDMYQLYVVTGVVNGWFATLLAVMNLFCFTLIATCAATGCLRVQPVRAIVTLALACGLLVAAVPAMNSLLGRLMSDTSGAQMTLNEMRLNSRVAVEVLDVSQQESAAARQLERDQSRLARVLDTRVIRVGYHRDMAPFSFFNKKEELVGFDVALLHDLAAELGVSLRFIPWSYDNHTLLLDSGEIDLAIGGLIVNARRLASDDFSWPYMTVTTSVVVEDHRRDEFLSWREIANTPDLRLAILGRRVAQSIRDHLPNAEVIAIDSPQEFFNNQGAGFDGLVMTTEGGYTQTIRHPRFDVAIAEPQLRGQLAFALPQGEEEWRRFLDAWIRLKVADGSVEQLYAKWILGQGASEAGPRWCVARDVLNWID
ncbi:cation:dicarboxylate symporter family transporter [Botrimarina hoheduenensis]|uniref:C4-dicarboxylate transport protein n=1 Tax=Botrimarina hoheduenensis TaxID=2528000 RepID=A0A5C5WDI2_9BACT|nr:cation:dicarboxylase symporter family transporter [Botrimarina hoheduenensis]TWT47742.1 C4-dicarboxylate transport protein [Botrimarina hoheduenensis]